MAFLRKLFGAAGGPEGDSPVSAGDGPVDQATLDDEERARELELARFEQDRTDDLVRRQQRYADRSWTPPAQGGPERADDEGGAPEG